MLSLEKVRESYGFKEVAWEVDGKLIRTEKGLKRLSLWQEKSMLQWHILWRDHLAKKTGCLTDRMIQSLYGERMILTDVGWLTLHDEVTSLFSYQNREKEIGRFFSKYFSMEVKTEEPVDFPDSVDNDNIYRQLNRPLKLHFNPKTVAFIEGLRKESLLRLSKSKRLREEGKQDGGKPPVVVPIQSLDQGKIVFEKLYWQNGTGNPEKGYRSLQIVLSQWLQRYGRKSLFSLLHEMDKHLSLRKHHCRLLLADCISPWEFTEFLTQLDKIRDSNELELWKEKLSYQWEESRELVKALSEWLDLTREKVPSV